jgi:hypothetical protein
MKGDPEVLRWFERMKPETSQAEGPKSIHLHVILHFRLVKIA